MEYWRVSSLVPEYMTVSWTVSPSAVRVRATCGVEGRPERGGEGEGRGRGELGAHVEIH